MPQRATGQPLAESLELRISDFTDVDCHHDLYDKLLVLTGTTEA